MSIIDLRYALFGTNTPTYTPSNLSGSITPSHEVYMAVLKKAIKDFTPVEKIALEEIPVNECIRLDLAFFGIGLNRCKDFKEHLAFIERNATRATSWMTTDFVNQFFKKPKFETWAPFFERMVKTEGEFSRRFAYGTALLFYKDRRCFDLVSKHLVKDERYYTMMMEAWLLASFAIYFPDEVYAILDSEQLTLPCRRKTVSKMCDSYRITQEHKDRAKALRLKWKAKS